MPKTIWFVGYGWYIIPYHMRPGQHPSDIVWSRDVTWDYVSLYGEDDPRVPKDVAWYNDCFVETD